MIILCSCRDNIPAKKTKNNLSYDQAFIYREKGMADSAFFHYNRAKDLYSLQKDSFGIGKCLVNMGSIAIDKGDYFGAQEVSLLAIPCFDQKQEDQLVYISSNFNNLGMASHYMQDYSSAIKFYNSAIIFARDSKFVRINKSNKAAIYQEIKDYKKALSIYQSILQTVAADPKEYARVLTSITYTKWLQNSRFKAVPDYLKAFHIRQQEKDLWGQNSSYAHLAQYYENISPDSAFSYAKMWYAVAQKIKSPDDQLGALKALVSLSPAKETKKYFNSYHDLNDSLKNARGSAKNQFALIRYETEKHKSEALKAKAENIEKKNRMLILNFILAALVLSLIYASLWYRKRKKIMEQDKEIEIKNTELKYVKKIHDRVANRVYHLMSELDNAVEFNKDLLVDKLEVLYDISRDISYENDSIDKGDYAEMLSEMLQSYRAADTEVLIVGNDAEIWKDIAEEPKSEFYVVMQELMTNMRKHSGAQTVVIRLQRDQSCITAIYFDNGVGMKHSAAKNGLHNTENRMNSIGGTITFEGTVEKEGLEITISFPIA
jgi:two-component sensor histidine kinase